MQRKTSGIYSLDSVPLYIKQVLAASYRKTLLLNMRLSLSNFLVSIMLFTDK